MQGTGTPGAVREEGRLVAELRSRSSREPTAAHDDLLVARQVGKHGREKGGPKGTGFGRPWRPWRR